MTNELISKIEHIIAVIITNGDDTNLDYVLDELSELRGMVK